jgi:type VI secretion system secreted protein VgrG
MATGETIGVTTPLGSALRITTFSGNEAISQLFEFQLGLVAPNGAHVPFESLIGQPVTVKIGARYFSGIVQRFGEGARTAHTTSYTAYVVPSLWLLTLSQQSRIFQKMSVPDILTQVLSGLSVDFQVKGTYPPRDYCVQYRETDFAFVSRLMEEEGIFYYFKHTSTGHTLVVTDSPAGLTPLAAPFNYDPTGAAKHDAGVIYAWEKDQQLTSGKVTLWDHEFELPNNNLEVQAEIQDSVLAGTVTHHLQIAGNSGYEVYDYPGDYAKRFNGPTVDPAQVLAEGQRTVGIRMQQETLPSLQVNGGSSAERLTPGYLFLLKGHFDANGGWVVTSVDHTAHAKAPNGPVTYTNDFVSIPAALPYRPPRTTPRPVVAGPQTAIVTGPAGEQTFPDTYGRVKVQFFWDRQGKNDENSSCWVRVGHPVAPAGTVPQTPPIGSEVIVDFEDGDPDKPIIVGSVDSTPVLPG